MSDEISAGGLLNSMISFYLDYLTASGTPRNDRDAQMSAGRYDLLLHMVQVVKGLGATEAMEWLAEELQERFVVMAD